MSSPSGEDSSVLCTGQRSQTGPQKRNADFEDIDIERDINVLSLKGAAMDFQSHLTLRHLRLVKVVGRELSLSRAAERPFARLSTAFCALVQRATDR